MEKSKKYLSLPVEDRFLLRKECIREARRILDESLIDDMSEEQLVREIRFHALAFHISRDSVLLKTIREHANPIDIASGGDTRVRRMIYALCWGLPDRIIKRK